MIMIIENINDSSCLAFKEVVNSEENRHGSCENTANLSITLKKIIQSYDRNMENFNPATKIQSASC